MSFVRMVFTAFLLGFFCRELHGSTVDPIVAMQAKAQVFFSSWASEARGALPQIPKEIVLDPEERLPGVLRVPPLMRNRVYFWLQIYGRFSSWMRVLHDREEPSLIYGYVDCSTLYETRKTRMQREIACERLERIIKKRMKALLNRLDRNPALQSYILSHGILHSQLPNLSKRLRVQKGQKDIYLLALQRSKSLIPVMEDRFERREIPSDLSRIPFVESSFHPKALSKVKAMGIWQFMPRTAKALIHKTDRSRWTDPVSQTDAAATMLQKNHGLLGDWGLTVTSYNSGVGRISRLTRKYRLNNIQELLFLPQPSKRLGFAGKNFYAEFLAANLLYNYQKDTFYLDILAGPLVTLLPTPQTSCINFAKTSPF